MEYLFRAFRSKRKFKKHDPIKETLKVSILALYTGLVYALQLALAFIPNVEVVTFMLALAGLIFTWYYAVGIAVIFCFLEMILAGTGVWEITYLVAWPSLVIITRLCKKAINKHWWIFVIINTLFGFSFGSLDTGINTLVYGSKTAMVYWMNGWIFDAIHGISNFIVAFLLYKPVKHLFDTSLKKYLF